MDDLASSFKEATDLKAKNEHLVKNNKELNEKIRIIETKEAKLKKDNFKLKMFSTRQNEQLNMLKKQEEHKSEVDFESFKKRMESLLNEKEAQITGLNEDLIKLDKEISDLNVNLKREVKRNENLYKEKEHLNNLVKIQNEEIVEYLEKLRDTKQFSVEKKDIKSIKFKELRTSVHVLKQEMDNLIKSTVFELNTNLTKVLEQVKELEEEKYKLAKLFEVQEDFYNGIAHWKKENEEYVKFLELSLNDERKEAEKEINNL